MLHKWRYGPTLLLSFFVVVASISAQDQKADDQEKKEQDDTKTFAGIMADYNKQYSAFMSAYRKERDPQKRRAIVNEMLPKKEDFAEQVFEIVKADPASEESFKALSWVQDRVRDAKVRKQAMSLLLKHHIESEQFGSLAMSISRGRAPSKQTEDTLKSIIEKNPHDNVKGMTTFAYMRYIESVKSYTGNEQVLNRLERMGDTAAVEYLKSRDQKELTATFEALVKSIKDNYADIKSSSRNNVTLGQRADAIIFARDRLQIGMTVPEITAEDVDGIEFNLSDYRGKVVFLDFWGDW